MGIEVKASTQYGDLRGTIAIDGWDGLATASLRGKCPKGYWPVGIELYDAPERGAGFAPDVYILAVDESILESTGPEGIGRYAREHGALPVFRFATNATLETLLPQIKRLSVVLQDKATRGVPLLLTAAAIR